MDSIHKARKQIDQKRQYTILIFILIYLSTYCVGCISLKSVQGFGNTLAEEISDLNIFTDEDEIQFGKTFAEQHAKEVTFYTDSFVINYINNLGQSLVRKCKRNDIRYTFKVVNSNAINAYAVPGGFIYVNTGLIKALQTESELAFVLGHEIGHIVGRHSMKRLTKVYGIELLKQLILDEDSGELKKLITEIIAAGLLFKYSRDNERESDYYGVLNVYDVGISPEGGAMFFETLQSLQKRKPTSLERMLSTHPVHSERIQNVRNHISRLPLKSGLRTDSVRFQQVKRRLR